MRDRFIRFFSLVGLLIGLTFAAQAQKVNQYEAAIPFDFNIGRETLAAGDYAFRLTNPLALQETLTMRNLKSGETFVFLITRNQADERSGMSQLVFNRYGDRYFLAEMTMPTLKAKFLRSKVETRLAKTKTLGWEAVALKK